ncbi:MAG TPA: hypothetical protein VJ692_15215 [Nitrospiraceae bacterium]|nr:hypothetical protein [Nitrospiraceae bacterium]
MHQILTVIVTIEGSAALLTPLVYAVGTLGGMQHKKLYPLLRDREGNALTAEHVL